MASFASHKVGEALSPFSFYCDHEGKVKQKLCDHMGFEIMDDLNVIRYTNNNVYEDIAWTHFAYLQGGIDLLKQILTDVPEYAILLEGFNNIDKGRKIHESGTNPIFAEEFIWLGNSLLLKQEQIKSVQPMFTKFDFAFKRFLTLATAMDFDADNRKRDRKTYSSFYMYMWFRGTRLLIKTRSFPSIINFEHRWLWIDKRMLKTWKKVDSEVEYIKSKIAIFLSYGESETR